MWPWTPRARRKAAEDGGFTLVELLVVLVVLAILLVIAFPTYLGFQKRAEKRTSSVNVRMAITAAEAYYVDHKTYSGMDLPALRAIDQGLSAGLGVTVAPDGSGYDLTLTQGGCTASYSGPGDGNPTNAC
jgi:type IV pilus assembly protein PilA